MGLCAEEGFLDLLDGGFADGFELGNVANGLAFTQAAGDAGVFGEEFGRGEAGRVRNRDGLWEETLLRSKRRASVRTREKV